MLPQPCCRAAMPGGKGGLILVGIEGMQPATGGADFDINYLAGKRQLFWGSSFRNQNF